MNYLDDASDIAGSRGSLAPKIRTACTLFDYVASGGPRDGQTYSIVGPSPIATR
jgi:hypothetical protein